MRTAAEELGPQDRKNSTGYEPNDHFITEAFVEFTQESVTEQRSPEDLDYDDAVIGQTLCRVTTSGMAFKNLIYFVTDRSFTADTGLL